MESDTSSDKTQVNTGGREIVKTKATATGTTLTGGEQIVEGVANETTINDGGIQTVSANGEAIKTKINEGGTLTVNFVPDAELTGSGDLCGYPAE